MNYVSYESYYIKDEELHILLAGSGKNKWYGFSQAESLLRARTMNDIHVILAGLYQKEYITWEKNKVMLLEPIYSIIQVLLRADVCMNAIISGNGHSLRSHYFYREQVVFIERSQREEDMLRITKICYKEWLRLLVQESYFPEIISDQDGELFKFEEVLEHQKSLMDCCRSSLVYSGFEKVDAESGRVEERLLIKERNFVYSLHLQKINQTGSKCRYGNWTEIIQKWVNQEREYDIS